jgi:hypothetical protein
MGTDVTTALEGPRKGESPKPSLLPPKRHTTPQKLYPVTHGRSDINTYFPMELLREIFLYSIEGNQLKSGDLASVCRHWRFVITSIASIWSTLRVGTWTERERVTTWLQRAYPKKVVIDTQRDRQSPSTAPPFAALQDALGSTSQWHELTISSFPPEELDNQLGFQVANPMIMLKVLHMTAGCVHSPSFAHLLDLVPTEAPLSELRLHPSFANTHFLQPHWFPVLQNLTVLIVNGRDIHEPFQLLPSFSQLQIFGADHLPLPLYEPNATLPLLCTLQKLSLRASSVHWMAGREFPYLEECAILLPHHWEAVQHRGVELPSCRKLTYHGYPMATIKHFRVPQMKAMELKSHDCNEQRVYQQLRHLCTLDGRISKLTVLHLTLQCSEQVFLKVLKYMGPLHELHLSVAYPSLFWQDFIESLAAKPSAQDWPIWDSWRYGQWLWEQWCSSQTWHANVLPHLKYLGIQCPKGFSQFDCLDNSPLFRLVGWTRAHSASPLKHLKVWEGRGITHDIAVDYISTGYLERHPEISSEEYDSIIVRAMVTRRLYLRGPAIALFKLSSTFLFRQLQDLEVECSNHEIFTLPCLEQIKGLVIRHGIIPAYSLDFHLPLIHTLQRLKLVHSTFFWMLGRTFKALKELEVHEPPDTPENLSRNEGLQVNLPACTTLKLGNCSVAHLHFFSCPNLQILRLQQPPMWSGIDEAAFKSLHDFLNNTSCLQTLEILIYPYLGLNSLIQFVFCDAWEQRIWHDIRSVEVTVWFTASSKDDRRHFFIQTVGHKQHYEKWWKEFTVIEEYWPMRFTVRGSM